jgi:ABC-2 type transport system ATP-binding protein
LNAIEIHDLRKSFGAQAALGGVDLAVGRGETLGLLGPNGAGKTTLVRCIMGRVRPDAGTIKVGDGSDNRKLLGWVPQDLALYPRLTAAENLAVFGRYQGLAGSDLQSAIDKCLEWSALKDRASEQVRTFSGGMKRRLNIAAGVIHSPKVLLLDEPTVGVDPQSRERIYQMIEELRKQGVSLIYTTHYMEEAERLCDRIAIIDHGRVIAEGMAAELVSKYLGPKREAIIYSAKPSIALERALLARSAIINDDVIRVPMAQVATELKEILGEFEREGVVIENIAIRTPTVEDVFLHLTGRGLRE